MVNDELPSALLERTHTLLDRVPRTTKLKEIAEASGVGLPWLSRFSRKMFADPKITNVQKLHDYLVNING